MFVARASPSLSSLICAVLATAGLAAGSSGPIQARQPPRPEAYTLVPATNGAQLRTPDGRIVFEYLTSKPADAPLTSPSVACLHPVNTPSGERVTALAPDDHRHHRGMYLAWSANARCSTSPLPPS